MLVRDDNHEGKRKRDHFDEGHTVGWPQEEEERAGEGEAEAADRIRKQIKRDSELLLQFHNGNGNIGGHGGDVCCPDSTVA